MTASRSKKKRSLKLRDKLFMSYSLLAAAILLAAAWAISREVVTQSRHEVQEEMQNSLPLYDAVWEEEAGRLSTLGMAMAGSPIVKSIFGDPRAARDRETIRQMLLEFGQQLTKNVDIILISDGGGNILFSESRNPALTGFNGLPLARAVAAGQKPAQSFVLLGGRLFHLALTPVTSHSGSTDFNNTLAVLIEGTELNRRMALELKRRAHSDVLFFFGDRFYASSLDPDAEADASNMVAARAIARQEPGKPVELKILGESQLAFARPLVGFEGRQVGYVVVLHSLKGVTTLFSAISRRLILVGIIGIILVLLVSYFIARRVTQPIESLAAGAYELGQGDYGYPIDLSPDGEIGQLAAAFEQMRQSLKQGQAALMRSERLATVGQMASGIIHDLRGPLATISTAAELFAGAELSQSQREVLAQSQLQASERMGTMLRDILEFSRGNYGLSLERNELAALIDTIIKESIPSGIAPRVAVKVHVPPNLFVRVDRERARRIFENLLINSVQAMPEEGTITICATEAGNMARINITDTGPGIPSELRDRLFEPFVSQGKRGGTGLGLAIASSIAKAHGGSLALVSADNQPAEFCVELPLDIRE
jgi:signal transduction histidine kinase